MWRPGAAALLLLLAGACAVRDNKYYDTLGVASDAGGYLKEQRTADEGPPGGCGGGASRLFASARGRSPAAAVPGLRQHPHAAGPAAWNPCR